MSSFRNELGEPIMDGAAYRLEGELDDEARFYDADPGDHEPDDGDEPDVRCPTTPFTPDGEQHTVIGCGSTNVRPSDLPSEAGIWDCLDCGIWFRPAEEA